MGTGATRTGVKGTQTTASLKGGKTSANENGTGFGVMGYNTGANDWASSTAPNFMYNEHITWNAAGYWTYSPVKYWPNGTTSDDKRIDEANADNSPSNTATSTNNDRLSFFAYGPWVSVADDSYVSSKISTLKFGADDTGKRAFYAKECSTTGITNGIAAITANDLEADPEVYYYMPTATTKDAVDLLWGLRGSKTYKETDKDDNTVTALGDVYNVDLTKQDVPETVNFLFKHALAKIGGNTSSITATSGSHQCGLYVVLDVDGNGSGMNGVDNQSQYLGSNFSNTKTLVTIEEVNVEDGTSANDKTTTTTTSDLKNSGWFDIAKGTWSNVGIVDNTGATDASKGSTYNIDADYNTTTYKLNTDIAEGTTVTNTTGTDWQATEPSNQGYTGGATGVVPTVAKPVYADTYVDAGTKANDIPALLMIPTADPQTLYVTVKYKVRTADPKLSSGHTVVTQTVTNKVTLTSLEANKYYKLVMHLGLTSVKFSAIVADWASTDDASYEESGTIDKDVLSAQEVWLPSNVINADTKTESAPGTSSNANTQAKTTEFTITLSGLAADQKILAEESATNITGVKINTKDITSEKTLEATDLTDGKAAIKVTLTPNEKVTPVANLVTITQKNSAGTVLTTTTVNIVQSAFDIVLSGTAGTVTVKDGDNTALNITDAKFTIEVRDPAGTVTSSYTTNSSGEIAITGDAGTYTVIVTYKDTDNNTVTKTIKTTKS